MGSDTPRKLPDPMEMDKSEHLPIGRMTVTHLWKISWKSLIYKIMSYLTNQKIQMERGGLSLIKVHSLEKKKRLKKKKG